jgi:hypothetical protein
MSSPVNVETERMREHIATHGDNTDFTRAFWRNCEPLDRDFAQFKELAASFAGTSRPFEAQHVSDVDVINRRIARWLQEGRAPKLGQFLRAYLQLGTPTDGWVWLNTKHSQGYGLPIGQFVQVPIKVANWKEIAAVLSQLRPVDKLPEHVEPSYAFGFLLGILIGDSNKWKAGNFHRHITLTLSKRYDTNLALGEFTSAVARGLGLNMSRGNDIPPGDKPHGFYTWFSESSPLVDWLFNSCLGLIDGQLTTYDEIHAEWVFDTPTEFRLGLLHGLYESDGSVSLSSKTIELWIGPSWEFGKRLLSMFGLRSFQSREAISMTKDNARKAARLPIFSPYVKSVRYQKAEILANAKVFGRQDRYPASIRERIQSLALVADSLEEIVETIAKETGFLVSYEATKRWVEKIRHVPDST